MLEGFTGNGAGSYNGDGTANPLNSIAELIAPIVERFSGQPIDRAMLESVVNAALEAQRARSEPAPPEPPPAKSAPVDAPSAVRPAEPAAVATERRK
jgi:hypothetical protein